MATTFYNNDDNLMRDIQEYTSRLDLRGERCGNSKHLHRSHGTTGGGVLEGTVGQGHGKPESALHHNYGVLQSTSIPSRSAYKIKADKTFQGRLVVQRWGQVAGVDYVSTFAPAYRAQSVYMVLATPTVELDCDALQLEVQIALLNADVEEEVYVNGPGLQEPGENAGIPLAQWCWGFAKVCAVFARAPRTGTAPLTRT